MSDRGSSRGKNAGRTGRGGSPGSRTSELARRRERRSSRLRLAAFSALILALVIAGTYMFWFRDSSLVAIKNLEIAGVDTTSKEAEQINQAVRAAVGEMTTLHVKSDLLDQEMSRFARIADTEIETAFPDSATVTVDMRKDGSIFGEGANALLIATDGTVLGPADGQEENLPLIVDGDPPEPAGGNTTVETLTGRALKQALILGAVPPELRTHLEESRMTADGVEIVIGEGLTILFGEPSQAAQKWRAAASLIADPEFDLTSYVDLTVPRRPAISPEVPEEESPESEPTGLPPEAEDG